MIALCKKTIIFTTKDTDYNHRLSHLYYKEITN